MSFVHLKSIFIACAVAALLSACGKGGANANQPATNKPAASNQSSGSASTGGQDFSKLDAEIMQLEAEAAQRPDDKSLRDSVANAYARRGAANYDAHKPAEALKDYQSALSYDPDHEEAQLRIEQIGQELGGVRTDDGKPVTVPAKPGSSNSNQ